MQLPQCAMAERLEALLQKNGLKITEQRRIVAQVLAEAHDHPDVEEVHRRASQYDAKISIATVYRTLSLLEAHGIIEKHDFRDGRARYEEMPAVHHDHLIDLKSGKVIEFHNEQIEKLQEMIAQQLGYRLIDHRLELYGVPLGEEESPVEKS